MSVPNQTIMDLGKSSYDLDTMTIGWCSFAVTALSNTAGELITKVSSSSNFTFQEFTSLDRTRRWRRQWAEGSTWTSWLELTSHSGITTNRPTTVLVGRQYFDTTLGKPIWLKSAGIWVDATGATV